jgi:hypothetical protein
MALRFALLVALGGMATACGGSSGTYAGLSEYEAAQDSLEAIGHDVNQRGNPLYRTRPHLVKLVRGESGPGEKTWVAVFSGFGKGARMCLWISAKQVLLNVNEDYFVDVCPANVLRTKDGDQAYG